MSVDFEYDKVGRFSAITRRLERRKYRTAYSFDEAGRLATLTFPDGAVVRYSYDGPFLTEISGAEGKYATFTEFDGMGRAAILRLGNGVTEKNRYCPEYDYRLCSVAITGPRGELDFQNELKYDPDGNVESILDPIAGDQLFEYDDLHRLVSFQGREPGYHWAYDTAGNITYSSGLGAYSLDAGQKEAGSHRLARVGKGSYTYDPSGREVTGPGQAFSYDLSGHALEVRSHGWRIRNTYDGQGGRVRREVWKGGFLRRDAENTLFVGPEYRCDANSCFRFIAVGRRTIAVETVKDGSTFYPHLDHLGSIRLVTDQAGEVVRRTSYWPFGTVARRFGQNVRGLPEVFAGLELEGDLYLAGTRYYDARIGRFLAADAVAPVGTNPQILNRYSYARNNPIILADPNGDNPFLIIVGISALLHGLQAGIESNWNFGAVLRGVAIGAVVGAVGAESAGLGLSPFVGGAAASATGAILGGGDVGRAALIGGLTAGVGSRLEESLGPALGGAAAGALGSALSGEDVGKGLVWGFMGAAATSIALEADSSSGEDDLVLGRSGQLLASTDPNAALMEAIGDERIEGSFGIGNDFSVSKRFGLGFEVTKDNVSWSLGLPEGPFLTGDSSGRIWLGTGLSNPWAAASFAQAVNGEFALQFCGRIGIYTGSLTISLGAKSYEYFRQLNVQQYGAPGYQGMLP
jgi:RHS repeat-associated protein